MPVLTPNPALDFEQLLREAEIAHGHLCAGQILGVRMAMLACRRLGTEDPRGKDRKRLVTYVEIDRCATDAIAVVTGCRLGKRALKFRDWGKMAATFLDLDAPLDVSSESENIPAYKAIRIAALESSKARARELYPQIENKNEQQMRAYRELPDADLFSEQWVRVPLHPRERPGYKSPRIACDQCGEGINYDREVIIPSSSAGPAQTLCLACAFPQSRYYQPLTSSSVPPAPPPPPSSPPPLLESAS
jgi:formylmethanofuran dehydrogenase subunit E